MKLSILNQPFPINDSLWFRQRAAGFGLFVFFFLLLFQPFSLHLYNIRQLLFTALIYGSISFITIWSSGFVFDHIITPQMKEESWTLGKQIVFNILLMICITLCNVFATQVMHGIRLPLWWYFSMLRWVIMMGVIPIVVSELIAYNWHLRKHLNNARQITTAIEEVQISVKNKNASPSHTDLPARITIAADIDQSTVERSVSPSNEIVITGENYGDRLVLPVEKLLAVQALDNYVNIYWEEHGILQTTLIRNTLTHVAEQLKNISCIFKSHRGWLVNIHRVQKVEGNAQSLKLHVALLSATVPVSRSNISSYRLLYKQKPRPIPPPAERKAQPEATV